MSDLSGRELDAAIARGLGWEISEPIGLSVGRRVLRLTNGARYGTSPIPEFHRSLDATEEHCGPWLRERDMEARLALRSGWSECMIEAGDFRTWFEDADTPALALARAVHAAQVAEQEAGK